MRVNDCLLRKAFISLFCGECVLFYSLNTETPGNRVRPRILSHFCFVQDKAARLYDAECDPIEPRRLQKVFG